MARGTQVKVQEGGIPFEQTSALSAVTANDDIPDRLKGIHGVSQKSRKIFHIKNVFKASTQV